MNCLLGFFAIFLVVSMSAMASVPRCPILMHEVRPCLKFIQGSRSRAPSEDCCEGVFDIYKRVKNKLDRVAICSCIKKALSDVGPYNASRIPLIPKKCRLRIILPPIDRKFNCSKVKV
ncbi:hypothetical protein F0562_019351 [Nyssa sinensis]|uniref:Non-specific lipid-transfer protein n=1 Tax=Nyssa sinensis TaxID=561372 RepID=A0A5J4ZEU6_9ASTE|nr:hypothetical protein F0562_019351 [Nyssa sinensis]